MDEQQVTFYSDGQRVTALIRQPDSGPAPRLVIHPPGWSGAKDSTLYRFFDSRLVSAGYTVLAFDYRGYGESPLSPVARSIHGQIRDIRNAISYGLQIPEVQGSRVALFGSGATGAAHVLTVAALDRRVAVVASQYPVAVGATWVRSGMPAGRFAELTAALAKDATARSVSGSSSFIARTAVRARPEDRESVPLVSDLGSGDDMLPLSFVEELLDYRPLEYCARVTAPTLVIAAEGDTMTPAGDARQLFNQVRGPRELILMRHTTHSRAYVTYGAAVMDRVAAWYDHYWDYIQSPEAELPPPVISYLTPQDS